MKENIEQMTAKAHEANAERKLEEVQEMLKHVSPDNHGTVGIILGREFDRSDEAWELYTEWAGECDENMLHGIGWIGHVMMRPPRFKSS